MILPIMVSLNPSFLSRTWVLILLLLLTAGAPYKLSTSQAMERFGKVSDAPLTQHNQAIAREHWLYSLIPRHSEQIPWYGAFHWISWALLGNDDDGIFGEEPSANYAPHWESSFLKAVSWTLRNPFHNLFFYVFGQAGKESVSEYVLFELTPESWTTFSYRPTAHTVFPGEHSGCFLGLHGGFPFFSLRWDYGRRLEFYIGWRERGNFGIKFCPVRQIPQLSSPPYCARKDADSN